MIITVRNMMVGRHDAGAVATSKMEKERLGILVRVSVAATEQHEQSKLGSKKFIWLTCPQH